jgi:hypothetical protein
MSTAVAIYAPRDATVASDEDVLSRLVQWVEDAESTGHSAREKSERDRDYYDGRQITHQEAEALKARNQPVIAFNLIQSKVDYLLGLEKQQRSDPKAFPRNPADEQAAEAATDAIRFVCDSNNMPMIASEVWESMVIEGAGGIDVCAEANPEGGIDVTLKVVHWDRLIWDQHSRERDYSDAKFLGIVLWMDEDDAQAQWPDAEDVFAAAFRDSSASSVYEDRPRWNTWTDPKRRRLRVVQLYWKEGKAWQRAVFVRGGFLEEPAPSPYVDEYGQPECPLVFAGSYVNRDNERYGVVRNLIDAQDEINLHHRKLVHLMSVRQTIAEQGAVKDVDVARRELAKPDGYIEVRPGMRFDINPTQDLSVGQAKLMEEARSIFQTLGPNAALMGKQGSSASGRAIALSQQGGAMEIGALLDVHRHWRRRVYRAIWARVKQYWTEEKWVRVTDDERNIRFVGLNKPQTDEFGRPVWVAFDEQGLPVQGKENDVSQTNVDIVVEEGPDVATLQIEQFEALAGLAKAGVPIPPDVLISASTLRNKEQILERMQQSGQAPPDPKMLDVQRKAQKDQADNAISTAEVQIKAREQAMKERELAMEQGLALQAMINPAPMGPPA